VSLASSDLTEHQAFRLGASAYGLLFHLEADEKQVELMGRAFAAEMAEAGVTSAELAQQTVHHAYASGVAGDRLFDTWARLL
jgi:GMP synthase-like glutamine amidotransferase